MRFTVRCECGREVEVGVPPAGGAVACPCGRSVAVPPASEEIHARLNRALLAEGARRREPAWARAAGSVAEVVTLAALGLLVLALAFLGLYALWDLRWWHPRGGR
jgi:hypothetical protein